MVIFLETAELRAKSKQETQMKFWKENIGQIITSNGFPLFAHAGKVSNEQMESTTNSLYDEYDLQRNKLEALKADQSDEAYLKVIENKIKHRPKH